MISLKPYRRAAVPLLAIQTPDPAEIMRMTLTEVDGGKDSKPPILAWDCIHGITALNEEAQTLADNLNKGMESAIATGNPIEALRALENLKDNPKTIVIALGLTEMLTDPQSKTPTRQALWNLRDLLTQSGSLLIITAPMGWQNPFPDDIAVAIDTLPTREKHIETAKRICDSADIIPQAKQQLERVGDALLGLSTFAAEQAVALSLTKQGIDLDSLWSRKRQQISETPGLSVYEGKETFQDLGGLDQAKTLFRSLLKGKRKPGAIVFIDEIEKAMSGSYGDTSGVSQSILAYMLSYMQDQNASGSIFVGPPGAAKSAMAKAIGNEGDIPTVTFDLGGIKGSLVGESEMRMRKALSVVTAISGGRPFFVATCNAISILPPELRRRFTVGTMFFDLPSEEEQAIIWNIYLKKFAIDTKQKLPQTEGWTGAEIRQCCDLADRLHMSLIDAAKFVIPVATSAREKIETLRKEASGRYLDASGKGVYVYNARKLTTSANRNINVE